jgi:hypothetical protein
MKEVRDHRKRVVGIDEVQWLIGFGPIHAAADIAIGLDCDEYMIGLDLDPHDSQTCPRLRCLR